MPRYKAFAAAALLAALLLLSVFLPGSAAAQAWPNEPAGSTFLNETGHDALTGNGWSDVYNGYTSSIVSDPTAPQSPSNVLQQKFPAGLEGGMGGGGGSTYNFGASYPEIFWGFWMKVDADYENHPVFTKIGWIHTPNNNLFLGMGGQGPLNLILNWQWADNSPSNSHLGFVGSGYLVSNQTFNKGEWVRVEVYFKPSTNSSSKDGKYYLWMNGVLAAGTDQLNTPDNPKLLPSAVSHITIWGGMGSKKTRDSYIWFDHEYISVPNCPNGCPVTGNTGGGSTTGGTTGGSSNGIRLVTRQAVVPRNATVKLKVVPKMPLDDVTIQVVGVFQEEGFQLTAGTYVGNGVWNLTPDDLTDLAIIPPDGYCGSINASVVITKNP